MTEVLQVVMVCLAAGFGSGEAPKGGLLEKWSGATPVADYQISNLANCGMIISHDLNNGRVVVDGSKYRRLSGREKRILENWLQAYQNRNVHHKVSLSTSNDATDIVTEPVHATASAAGSLIQSIASAVTPDEPTRQVFASSASSAPSPTIVVPDAVNRPTLRVLCIEDSEAHARQLRSAMTGSRIEMLAAPNIAAALDWLGTNHVDAVVVALNKPGIEAQATLDHARVLAARLPVVIITAFDDRSMRHEAIARGFQDFAPKTNLNVATLQYLIENSVDRFRMRSGRSFAAGG